MYKLSTDPRADAIYVQVSDLPIAYSKELDDNRIVDYNYDDAPVGVEFLSVSEGIDLNDLPVNLQLTGAFEGLGIKILA